mgnify:FL=1
MAHLSPDDRKFFEENGYLVKHDLLTEDQIQKAQEVIWENLENETDVDRNDPRTWIRDGPRTPSGGNHPDIVATLMDSPVFPMVEELVGKDKVKPPGFCGPALNYPSEDKTWMPPDPQHGHLDYFPPDHDNVGFTIGGMIYVDDVSEQGGGFVVWPGTHLQAMRLFHKHACDLEQMEPFGAQNLNPQVEPIVVWGPPGTVCIWHGNLFHNISKNCSDRIRLALIIRMRRFDFAQTKNEFSGNIWKHWEGIGENQ